MQIFKFGGASVKDAEGVKNLAKVLQTIGYNDTLIVISAMGKTTNALELVIKNYFNKERALQNTITKVITYHNTILLDLFKDSSHCIFETTLCLLNELQSFLENNTSTDYDFVYDQVICYGELVSTTIVSAYLNFIDIKNQWVDARKHIKTDHYYRNANIDWKQTQEKITSNFNINTLNITQGFIGSNGNNYTTTLGREGSDYSAAIYAYCLNAERVVIWKDVPGVLNADPRYFEDAQLLHEISYKEAIELAFYGASVIHPKTLQPLQKKEIPLHVKSFINPKNKGTKIGKGIVINPKIPCLIVKKDQILISLSTLDFSYIVEQNMRDIFSLLHQYKMKVNLMQNSAISFSICIENNYNNLEKFLQSLKLKFSTKIKTNVNIYTIRHYNDNVLKKLEENKTILLKQLTQETIQVVTV